MQRPRFGGHSEFSFVWLVGGIACLFAAFWLLSQPDSSQALSNLILPLRPPTRAGNVAAMGKSLCAGADCRNPVWANAAAEFSTSSQPALVAPNGDLSASIVLQIPSQSSVDTGATTGLHLAQPSQEPGVSPSQEHQESARSQNNAPSGNRDSSEHPVSNDASPKQSGSDGGSHDGDDQGGK